MLITVKPKDDTELEGAEDVTIELLAGSGYSIGSNQSATITIADDELRLHVSVPINKAYEDYTNNPPSVIDPDSNDDVLRLLDLYWTGRRQGMSRRGAMQAALREFANPTPPKPDEPMGLGAVVRVRDGDLYVSAAVPGLSSCRWVRVDETSEGKPWCYHNFNFLDVVEVLSEGVAS